MRVGFDVTPIATHQPRGTYPRGVRRVVDESLKKLEERGRLEVVRLAPPPGSSVRHWLRKTVPAEVRERGLAGIHSFTSGFPLRGPGARVQTIHELPWKHGATENAGWKHRLWALIGPLVATRVVTATEHVARDFRTRRLPGAAKLRVIPWGVGPPFADEPAPGQVDEVVLGRYRLPEDPLVLCLGGAREKKNAAALLHGLARVRERNGPRFSVVITGEDSPALRRNLGLASQLGLAQWVTTLDSIEEEDLPSLLRLSTAVAVLSKSEGFGLPVLEALACGTPVVVARNTAQAEVAGTLGIEVDPNDRDSVADGLCDAHNRREELRYVLSERAAEFTWDACAEKIEALWNEIAT